MICIIVINIRPFSFLCHKISDGPTESSDVWVDFNELSLTYFTSNLNEIFYAEISSWQIKGLACFLNLRNIRT
jgi:hypothetical protein